MEPVEYRLLEKTELWIKPVRLSKADLGACARATAGALGLHFDEVMVTDAMGDTLTLDILVPTIKAEQVVGRKEALIDALKIVPGVEILDATDVHSDGVLGLISLDPTAGREVLKRSRQMTADVSRHIRMRSMVCATGRELLAGEIMDTNTPFLLSGLKEAGYQASKGPVLEDDAASIARAFRRAAEEGYGLLITTGGIGAEGKDQTLEALGRLDPGARMPYILKFEEGKGRHHRDGVRIGVGYYEPTLIVCLPGPHDEVKLAWPVLLEGVKKEWDKESLAEALAESLRGKFLAKSKSEGGFPGEGRGTEDSHGIGR
jgi:molybdenum cofactor synthesis domain-containing protein